MTTCLAAARAHFGERPGGAGILAGLADLRMPTDSRCPRHPQLATLSTLFMVVAKWFGPDWIDELLQAKTGQVLTARVVVPHAGWP
jgi:hypothetical protein